MSVTKTPSAIGHRFSKESQEIYPYDMFNFLTIDIEDYFQVHAFSRVIRIEDWENYESRIERNTDRLLEILEESRTDSPRKIVRATFFVLGWIAEKYPHLIRAIQERGHEIGCHGYGHQLIYGQSRRAFREDIKKAKAILEDITGDEVIGYRAPSYSITNQSQWAFEVLVEEGFKYDSSIFPIHHDFYGIPDAPRFPFIISMNGSSNFAFSPLDFHLRTTRLSKTCASYCSTSALSPEDSIPSPLRSLPPTSSIVEFPVSTAHILGVNVPISGGGYFRLLPYPLIKKGLERINRVEERPFVFYLHPWELDPDQPRLNSISWKARFRHYVNLHKTENRFRKLLRDFHFTSIKEAINSINQ